jgi:Sap, sulfolipid-1-addressing protein
MSGRVAATRTGAIAHASRYNAVHHQPSAVPIVVVVIVFTVIAACTVAIPVIAYLIAADRLRGPLDGLRGWLEKENAVIMAILLLVIGVSMIGKGIGSF